QGDSPLAERKAAALAVDPDLLGELLGRAELRDLLDPDVLDQTERELQRLTSDRRARDAEGVADLLRLLGPLTTDEVAGRCTAPTQAAEWIGTLESARRCVRVRIAGRDFVAAVEDVARLRDALGVPVPPGVPAAFTEPIADPLGDLVARYARTHGPFQAPAVATRLGLGNAVVSDVLHRLAASGRLREGEFRPDGHGNEWCDAGVLRRVRRRSLAAARAEVEPVDPVALGRFLPAWQGVGGHLRGTDGVLAAVEQLAGCAVPASALEPFLLRGRVSDYQPAMLDELTASGEVVWAGAGALPGADGWLSLHLADTAPLTLPSPVDVDLTDEHQRVLEVLAGGGGYFFRQLSDATECTDDQRLAAVVWELAWAGYLTNDTLAPLRSMLGGGTTAHRPRRAAPRGRLASRARTGRPAMPSRTGPPTMAGRWSRTPERVTDPTRRAHAAADQLLQRHGVVTRGAVAAERVPGGFGGVYKVLAAFEDTGKCRRGYFVAGLGAAQFGTSGAVDRLRSYAVDPAESARAPSQPLVLAATDPANPFGAALPWPDRATETTSAGHRPGRKAGSVVVLVGGSLVLYVERGGRTLLTFTADDELLQLALGALADAVRAGGLGTLTVERADGEPLLGSPMGTALEAAGFHATPRGVRLRP
ncbi:MAG: DNA glycosylase AlkZ-like family protein, partial [Nocardioidaceae bacterium]